MNNNINKLHKNALKALNQKDYQLAHQCLLSILSCDKYFADAYFLLGIIASDHHNVLKGIQLTHQAHMLKPDNSEYIGHLAKLYALDNQSVQAKRTLDKLTRQEIKNALTLDTIGVAYSKIGLHAQAVDYFKQAVKIKPNNENFHFNLAAALKFSGKFLSAKSAYETTIKLKPNHYKAHAALSSLSTISLDNNHLATLTSTFKTLKHSDDKLLIGHAIAREYEALKDYDKSFQALMTAKQGKLSALTYSLDDDKAMFTSIIAAFENDNLQTKLNDGYQNDEAVFVVGMPRTGTTLVERILSNHQDISTAGELQNFGVLFKQFSQTKSNRVIDPETIRGSEGIDFKALGQSYIESTRVLTGNNKKFVDKMPLNILYAGFIIRA